MCSCSLLLRNCKEILTKEKKSCCYYYYCYSCLVTVSVTAPSLFFLYVFNGDNDAFFFVEKQDKGTEMSFLMLSGVRWCVTGVEAAHSTENT